MENNFYNKGQSLVSIIIIPVIIGLIVMGGLYFYFSRQIPEIPKVTQQQTEEKTTNPEGNTTLPSEEQVISTPQPQQLSQQEQVISIPVTPEEIISITPDLPNTFRSTGDSGEVIALFSSSIVGVPINRIFEFFISSIFAQEQSPRTLFYLEYSQGGVRNYHLFSYNIQTKEKRRITQKPISAPITFSSSRLGYLVYSSGNILNRVDIKTGTTTVITSSYEGPWPISISPDGKRIGFFRGNSRVVIFNIETLKEEGTYTLPSNTIKNRVIWSSIGDSIYVLTIRSINGLGVNDIVELNLNSQKSRTILSTDTAKHQLFLTGDSTNPKFLFNESAPGSQESSFVEYNILTETSKIIETLNSGNIFFTGYVMDSSNSTLYYTREDQGLVARNLNSGKPATLISQIQSTPYLKLIGFGQNENELVVSGLARGKDGVQSLFYYLYNISKDSWEEIVSAALPQGKGS